MCIGRFYSIFCFDKDKEFGNNYEYTKAEYGHVNEDGLSKSRLNYVEKVNSSVTFIIFIYIHCIFYECPK